MTDKIFSVCTGEESYKFQCCYPWAAISISTDPGHWYALDRANRHGWIQVHFADYLNERVSPSESLHGDVFTIQKAREILDFVNSMWNRVGCFMVHEESTPSRSAAIVAAVIHIHCGREKEHWVFEHFKPNMLVYHTLLRAYYELEFCH